MGQALNSTCTAPAQLLCHLRRRRDFLAARHGGAGKAEQRGVAQRFAHRQRREHRVVLRHEPDAASRYAAAAAVCAVV
jgi:hypothetical protein